MSNNATSSVEGDAPTNNQSPKIFRTMFRDGNFPQLGAEWLQLGVRVPTDIKPDNASNVHPGKNKGMSVAPEAGKLPAVIIPARLKSRYRNAMGPDDAAIWSFGTSAYSKGPINDALELVPTSPTHGVVAPANVMPLESFQQELGKTQPHWVIDEY
ncbi:hypothetical protein HMI51_15670 [Corallococcus coralloides]|nr:hypothetical protein [Corallococcus coralloides]